MTSINATSRMRSWNSFHDIHVIFAEIMSPHEIGMDDKNDEPSSSGLYVLFGAAIVVALVWVLGKLWM